MMRATRSTAGLASLLAPLALSACNCDSGSGLTEVRPLLDASPEMIEFGEVPVGELVIRSFHLKNKGQAELVFTQFDLHSATGEYIFATPVPTRFKSQDELDFNVVFEPMDPGEENGSIVIDTNDGKGAHTITLHGIGVRSSVAVTHDGDACMNQDKSVDFGHVVPLSTADRTITVKATGSAPVTVLSAVVEPGTSGELTIDGPAMPKVLQPGEQLDIRAHYTPSDGGPDSGAFVITTDNAENPSIRITACGEGAAPAICADPLDFGRVGVGSSSTKPLTIRSCGFEPVDVTALSIALDAAHMSNPAFTLGALPAMPMTLAPGETVDVDVTFTVTAQGPAQGWIAASSTTFGHPESFFSLYGEGGQPCGLQVLPTSLVYNNVQAGQTQQQAVVLANSGASDCSVSRIEVTMGASVFSVISSLMLPVTIPSGGNVQIGVQYAPTAGGVQDDGVLEVEESGAITPVTLTGNPPAPDGCRLQITPPAINFGVVPPNTMRSMGVSVNNVSQDFCTLRGVTLDPSSSPDFTNTSPSFGLILPGRSKTVSVLYRPTAVGAATGQLNLTTSDVVTPNMQVPIFASSAPTGICVSPRNLAFGPTQGTATQIFTITACGTNSVTVNALDWTRTDPEISLMNPPALPFTLAAGASQAITVMYQSMDMNGDTAVVTVRSSDLAEPNIDVTVTGGPEIVPASAGRFLYYWQIPSPIGGNIMQLPLQGATTAQAWWGPATGKQCSGCHSVSPDGRYVAIVELPNFRVVDTSNNIALALPNTSLNINFVTWRPDVNSNPPYQYVYDDGTDIHIAALFDGYIGTLHGADDPSYFEQMPSWGPNGKIAFVRGTMQAQSSNGNGSWGLNGPTDIMVVDEAGGVPSPVPGASANSQGNYYPRYSPNGSWIAFTQSASAQSTIAATDAQIRLAPGNLTGSVLPCPTLNGNNGASSFPTWSVDGAFLSFSSNRSGGRGDWDIYIAPVDPATGADGAAVNVVEANTAAFEHSAQWSP